MPEIVFNNGTFVHLWNKDAHLWDHERTRLKKSKSVKGVCRRDDKQNCLIFAFAFGDTKTSRPGLPFISNARIDPHIESGFFRTFCSHSCGNIILTPNNCAWPAERSVMFCKGFTDLSKRQTIWNPGWLCAKITVPLFSSFKLAANEDKPQASKYTFPYWNHGVALVLKVCNCHSGVSATSCPKSWNRVVPP